MNVNPASGGVWAANTWDGINKAVEREAGQIRVVQKVFRAMRVPGARYVSIDQVEGDDPIRIEEGATRPFVEIQGRFQLTQAQIENEATGQPGRKLARIVAKNLALAEDLVLLRGKDILQDKDVTEDGSTPLSPKIQAINPDSVQEGLLKEAKSNYIGVPPSFPPADFFQHVLGGITRLTGQGKSEPYALLIADDAHVKLHQAAGGLSATFLTTIKQAVAGGLFPTRALGRPQSKGEVFGLLAALGDESVSIYVESEPCVAFTQRETNGMFQFRVSERVQYVVRDEKALLHFVYE